MPMAFSFPEAVQAVPVRAPTLALQSNRQRPLRSLIGIHSNADRLHKNPVLSDRYISDGDKMMFEYPRVTPQGEHMDSVEITELNDEGLIQSHKVYWGWRSFCDSDSR
jgi:hypothetical protein